MRWDCMDSTELLEMEGSIAPIAPSKSVTKAVPSWHSLEKGGVG